MPFSYLAWYARHDLDNVEVIIDPVYGFWDEVWNQNEVAFVKVNVINTSGVLLRDVVLQLSASGAVVLDWFGLDDTWYWPVLESGESGWAMFLLQASRAGHIEIRATLSAEVVPYATRTHDATRYEYAHRK